MTHVFRWRSTRYGPLHPELAARFGAGCDVVVRGKRVLLVRFADGYEVVVMRYAVRRAGHS